MVTPAPLCASTSAAISPAGPAPMIATAVIPGCASWRSPGIHNLRSWLWIPGSREDARPGMTESQLHARSRRSLRDIFLGLLECAFQCLRRRHVADLGKMRRDGIRRPFVLRQIDPLGFQDLDQRK